MNAIHLLTMNALQLPTEFFRRRWLKVSEAEYNRRMYGRHGGGGGGGGFLLILVILLLLPGC